MRFTFCVSNADKSKEVSCEHPSNIEVMNTVFEVFKFSIPSIVVNFLNLLNQLVQSVGRALAKDLSDTTLVTSEL